MKNLSGYSEFCNILELVFVLSHGQADIEIGFSLNKNLLKQNMEALTITSRRKIKDYLLCNEIKLNTYTITSKMLESVQLSRQKYEVYLQENKSKIKQDEKQKQIALIEDDIGRINERIELVNKTVSLLDDEFILLKKKAEKDNNISLIPKANAMKRKSSEKKKTRRFRKLVESCERKA